VTSSVFADRLTTGSANLVDDPLRRPVRRALALARRPDVVDDDARAGSGKRKRVRRPKPPPHQ